MNGVAWDPAKEAKMRKMFDEGYVLMDIAGSIGVSLSTIERHLRADGLFKTSDMPKKKIDPETWEVHSNWMSPSRLITPVMPKQFHFKKGEKARLLLKVQGGNIDRKMVYLGEVKGKNRMHLFQSVHGGYKESFTDMQIAEVIRR